MSPELIRRLGAALVLVPLVVAGVLMLPTAILATALGALTVLGAGEWGRLAGWRSHWSRGMFSVGIAASMAVLYPHLEESSVVIGVLGAAVVWWAVALNWVVRAQQEAPLAPGSSVAVGWLVLVPTWSALVALHRQPEVGPALALYALVLVWVADSAAYFAGRRFGRVRLAPRVSPGKSWEGVAGGLAGVLVLALAGAPLLARGSTAGFALLCLASAAVSVVGDLTESLLKRRRGMKDSGTLIPGHGGIMDRIDGLCASAPVFALGYLLPGLGA